MSIDADRTHALQADGKTIGCLCERCAPDLHHERGCDRSGANTCGVCARWFCWGCDVDVEPRALHLDIAKKCHRCAPPEHGPRRSGIEQLPSGLWVPEDVAREMDRETEGRR